MYPDTAVIVHHLGCGADAADPVRLSVRLMQEIARLVGEEFQPKSDPDEQLDELAAWLATASAWAGRTGRTVLMSPLMVAAAAVTGEISDAREVFGLS